VRLPPHPLELRDGAQIRLTRFRVTNSLRAQQTFPDSGRIDGDVGEVGLELVGGLNPNPAITDRDLLNEERLNRRVERLRVPLDPK